MTCQAVGCDAKRRAARPFCTHHWDLLTPQLRTEIWHSFPRIPGTALSPEWEQAVARAIEHLKEAEFGQRGQTIGADQ